MLNFSQFHGLWHFFPIKRHRPLNKERKKSLQISQGSLHRLIRVDTFRFDSIFLKGRHKNPVNAKNVVPDQTVRTAQANLGQHFTHMHFHRARLSCVRKVRVAFTYNEAKLFLAYSIQFEINIFFRKLNLVVQVIYMTQLE